MRANFTRNAQPARVLPTGLSGIPALYSMHVRDRILFVSDLHLDDNQPQAVAQFIEFLRGAARDARRCTSSATCSKPGSGDDDDDRHGTRSAPRCAVTRAMCPAHVVRGNRDFLLGAGFEQRSGCRLLPDPVRWRRVIAGVHLAWRPAVHERPFATRSSAHACATPSGRRVTSRCPWPRVAMLAETARRGQRRTRAAQQAQIMDVHPDAVAELFRVSGTSLLIHGHTHRPAVHTAGGHRVSDGAAHRAGRLVRQVAAAWRCSADGRYEIIAAAAARRRAATDQPSAWSPATRA